MILKTERIRTIGFSFLGSWTIFEVINSWFKNSTKLAFICSFLIPTVVIWSGGIIKDSLVFGMIGLLIYAFYRLFFHKRYSNILLWIALFLSAYIVFRIKSYLLISLAPSLVLALYLNFKSKIQSKLIRQLSGPILFVFMSVSLLFLIQTLASISEKYEIDKLEKKARGFHTWHVTTGGATYNLGEIDYTAAGVAKKIPEALNVTFFRPYLWEISNLGMAISAIESFSLLLLFIYLIGYKGYKSIKFIFKDPFLTFFIVFSLILGFAAGFTSYNFGALVRYKMPLMPFFTFTLLYIANLKLKGKLK